MLNDTLKKRLTKDRAMTTVTLRCRSMWWNHLRRSRR